MKKTNKTQKTSHFNSSVCLENTNSSKKFKQEDRFYGKILLVCCCCGRFFLRGVGSEWSVWAIVPPGPCTVCSNGFNEDISNQHQVQQYKSCLKSFL